MTDPIAQVVEHLVHAHQRIIVLKAELSILNKVIARRKHAYRDQREGIDAVKRLHRFYGTPDGDVCYHCSYVVKESSPITVSYPCPTIQGLKDL